MKVIHQKHYPTLQVDSNENDIVQIAQNGKEDFNLIMVEKERARDFALLVCPELAEEIERLKAFVNSFIKDFEGDYVIADGTIVDNPNTLLVTNYKAAKKLI